MDNPIRARHNISSELLKELKRLEIHSRKLADADLVGRYKTAFRGSGLIFSELREYQPGDDIRHIHWKATARARTAFVKTYQEDRQLNIVLALDVSRSMLYGTPKSKEARAREFAALITTLSSKNLDNVSLCIFADDIVDFIPLRAGRKQVMKVLYSLFEERVRPRDTRIDLALSHLALHLKKTSVVFLISDFYSDYSFEEELKKTSSKHDVTCIQMMDLKPSSLPKAGLISLFDSESGQRMIVDSSSDKVRSALRKNIDKHANEVSLIAKRSKAEHILLYDTLDPFYSLMSRRAHIG